MKNTLIKGVFTNLKGLTMMLIEEHKRKAVRELIKLRRDFHKYPESGWTEYRTSAKIASFLESLGYEVYVGKEVCKSESRMGVPNTDILKKHEERALSQGVNAKWIELMGGGHTGVVGVLKTGYQGPTIALRFDIDSLDIQESKSENHLPFKQGFHSVHEGVMHACGHDGHTAIGLGVARELMEKYHLLKGEVRLIFQPAEEGCRGAQSIVDRGWLDNVNYFYSGHIAFQSFTFGEVVAGVDGFLATTKIDVTYKGKASHAGDKPEAGKNALLAASAASLHLHTIPRHSKGKTRINVGTLQAGSGRNIIPNSATMSIETRGETTELNDYMTNHTIRIIENVASMYDVDFSWNIVGSASEENSNKQLTDFISKQLESMKEITSIVNCRNLNASEDAVTMMKQVHEQGGKAAYLLFGSPIPAGHHEPEFDYDENVLPIGVDVFTRLVITTLNQEG